VCVLLRSCSLAGWLAADRSVTVSDSRRALYNWRCIVKGVLTWHQSHRAPPASTCVCTSVLCNPHSAKVDTHTHTHTHTHTFNGSLSRTTRVSRYQKGKTNLDFTEARDSEWQWHQLGHVQVCTSLQTDNHASTTPLSFLQAECSSCRPTNSVKALKAVMKAKLFCPHNAMLARVLAVALCLSVCLPVCHRSEFYRNG